MKFGLRNINALLRYCGNPHRKFKSIHVAGTNGKGSTSSMIAAILTAAGYKVGLYTSPHLIKFNERIRINGRMISDADVAQYTKKLKPQIHKVKSTFFEATTAIAFQYFADQHVDIAVIETGLGGRLDSTNVIKPIASVITSIGKDHTEHLGNTLEAIAKEKAGIIKQNVPVILGNIKGRALNVICSAAKEKRAPVVSSSHIRLPTAINLQLKGKHQIVNAKMALAAVAVASKYLLVGDYAVRQGLEHTVKYTGLRARLELIKKRPAVLLDVAHNPDGIKILVSELQKLPYKKFVVLFAVMKDKDYTTMLRHFKKLHHVIIATQPATERALPSAELFRSMKGLFFNAYHEPNIAMAIAKGKRLAGKKGLLVITGSHYLVGEALQELEN